MTNQRYFVGRRPDNGRWAVYERAPDGSRSRWIDEGWRDSANAELQRIELEMAAEKLRLPHG